MQGAHHWRSCPLSPGTAAQAGCSTLSSPVSRAWQMRAHAPKGENVCRTLRPSDACERSPLPLLSFPPGVWRAPVRIDAPHSSCTVPIHLRHEVRDAVRLRIIAVYQNRQPSAARPCIIQHPTCPFQAKRDRLAEQRQRCLQLCSPLCGSGAFSGGSCEEHWSSIVPPPAEMQSGRDAGTQCLSRKSCTRVAGSMPCLFLVEQPHTSLRTKSHPGGML